MSVTTERIPLPGEDAMAFHASFDKRLDYIHAEKIHHLIDGPDRVPLPGCPQCGAESGMVAWRVYEQWIALDVDPCGHRFRVECPVMETVDDMWVREWMP